MKEVDPLTFLKTVYMNMDLPLSVRMRAAMAVLPFTHPKLAVTAVVSEHDFATVLDRRLKRIEEMKTNAIEATPLVDGEANSEERCWWLEWAPVPATDAFDAPPAG